MVSDTFGFIGTGVMGMPMAHNLLSQGVALSVYDVDQSRVESLELAGATACSGPGEVARTASVLFIMVRDRDQTEQVIFGANGVARSLNRHHVLVIMSTLSAGYIRELCRRLPETAIVDAPVSGGRGGAAEGTLTIMVGAHMPHFERIEPVLRLMGKNVRYVGAPGSGQTAKAANQILVVLNRAAVGEALLFARRDGGDPELIRQVLMHGLGQSAALDSYGKRVSGNENPVMFESEILKKDINNIVEVAEGMDLTLPFSSLARVKYNEW